ncbi:hypothetical protein MYX82_12915 [Acidobacteria bacterium AH-259-D05]|nr:hypothetical protein [Acidobacteria bacterium AH-259-D05]
MKRTGLSLPGRNPNQPSEVSVVTCQPSAVSRQLAFLSLLAILLLSSVSAQAQENSKAHEVIAAAIEAMGGKNYLGVKNYQRQGRYFIFDRRGRQGFSRFFDWTVFEPIKWRFQLGEGKRQQVQIYNLEIEKGWVLEGKSSVEEIPEEEIQAFKKDVQSDIDILLRNRADEEGMNLYYYGPDDVAGSGEYEAVEFLDATNNSVVIFFDLQSHLPSKMENYVTNKLGIRQKQETEFYNWHTIQGVHTPLRTDHFTDGEKSRQIFVEEVSFNVDIPSPYFLEPKPEK